MTRLVVGVWDVVLGRTVATLRGSGGPVTAVAFGPDGRSLAIGAADRGPQGQVVTSGTSPRPADPDLRGRARPDQGPRLQRRRPQLAAGGGRAETPGWVTAWDAETGAVLGTLDRVGLIMSLAFHPDGVRLAVADFEGRRFTSGTSPRARGSRSRRRRRSVASRSPRTAGGWRSLGYDGNVHLADARTGDDVLVLRSASARPSATLGFTPRMAFSPDGSRIAANGGEGPEPLGTRAQAGPGGRARRRRSRRLAPPRPRPGRAGDVAGAEAASARARDLDGGDASPWIEHAVVPVSPRRLSQARMRLSRAMEALPDDPGRWIDLGPVARRDSAGRRSRRRCGRGPGPSASDGSPGPPTTRRPRPWSSCSRRPSASAGWTVLQPDVMTSAAGATLTRLPDDSVLAGGLNPSRSTRYTVEAMTGLSGITGLRLEALPDPSLPHRGPGRDRRMATSSWTRSACAPSPGRPPRSRSTCPGPSPTIRSLCYAPHGA